MVRVIKSLLLKQVLGLGFYLVIAIPILILLTLIYYSKTAFFEVGLGLFSTDWFPPEQKYGILAMLYGSATVVIMALILGTPLALFSALALSELTPKKSRLVIKSILEILAGIPSIVYGLLGVVIICPWLETVFGLSSGRTLFAGGLILALMILPMMMTLFEDIFSQISHEYRLSAKSLGLNKTQVITSMILPMSRYACLDVLLLSISKALGETMAIMLVIGCIDKFPNFWLPLSAGQTVTSKLGRELGNHSFYSVEFSVMIAMALILLLPTVVFTFIIKKGARIK